MMGNATRILVVDDQYPKVKAIHNVLPDDMPGDIDHALSSRQALRMMTENDYDLLVIDLQIPEAMGEDVKPYAGRDLLEYIDDNRDINRPTHILGITSHADSYSECLEAFAQRGWTLLHGIDDTERLRNIVSAKLKHAVRSTDRYDVVMVTALEHVELEEVLRLPCNWIPFRERDDCSIVHCGRLQTTSGHEVSVLASACPRIGIAHAAALSMKLCLKYSPKFLMMTGIAAGIEGKTGLGDILIADPCWDWGSGKQTLRDSGPVFLASPTHIALDPPLRAQLKRIVTTRLYLDEIVTGWSGGQLPTTMLKAHIGPLATGSMVLEDPAYVAAIQQQHRDTLGVDMEAYGIAVGCAISSAKPPKAIVLKSVCDFANPLKNDTWQTYAAYTSAQFAMRIIQNDLF
ncbi:MAG: response regulator [Lentisphaerae bacterium]|nr:response regulator [Lentisphaerota bacterium]